jgi:TolA-binding protein
VSAETGADPHSLASASQMRRWSGPHLSLSIALAAAMALAGCTLPADNQQAQSNEDLRGIVASDRQQINALQDQVSRLNDQIAEMQHNGDDGAGGSPSDKTQLAELQREVKELKSGSSAPAEGPTGSGAPPTSGPGSLPNPAGSPDSPPGLGGPEGTITPPETGAGPSAGTEPSGGSGSIGAPGIAMSAPGGAPNANSVTDANDDNSSDSGDNAPEVASNAPPPPPPAASIAPGPPLVSGAPSWRPMLAPEMAAAQSSNDPAAKTYRAGLANMKAGKYLNAVGVFQALQRKYPKSSFSEPAEYFSANALYELGKYDQAILQFNDLTMRFPRGRFASASLLSEAQAFMKMDDRIDARLTLQKLLDEHPDTAEARTARAMMNSLANG